MEENQSPALPPSSAASAHVAAPRDAQLYDRFARIYNARIAHDFRNAVMHVLSELLLDLLPPHAAILDVCSGAGQVAHALVERGFHVTGVDVSAEMLRLAAENAPSARFLRRDVRALESEPVFAPTATGKFDAAIATFNSFAHLSDAAELRAAFCGVRLCLGAGAPFVFDLSMFEQYWMKWRGSFEIDADGLRCVVAPSFDVHSRVATNRIVLFDETTDPPSEAQFDLLQKCHSRQEVVIALARAGFRHVESFDAARELGMAGEAGRRFFRAIA